MDISFLRCQKLIDYQKYAGYFNYEEEKKEFGKGGEKELKKLEIYNKSMKIYRFEAAKMTKIQNLELEGLWAEYLPNKPILKNINLKITSPSKIGIVGRTGCGKSSLIRVLWRDLDFKKGTYKINGKNIKEVDLKDFRSLITIINQDSYLIEGTLLENILTDYDNETYGKYDINDIDENKILNYDDLENDFNGNNHLENYKMNFNENYKINFNEKLKKAKEFFYWIQFKNTEYIKNGLNMKITENGDNLSFGEKQIINIARVAISDKPIAIMDEVTSSLDIQTEQKIQSFLNKCLEKKLVFIIAHRIKTVKDCDKIIVIKDGMIEDFDSYLNLKKRQRDFSKIIKGF